MKIRLIFIFLFYLTSCDAIVPVKREFGVENFNTLNCVKDVMREIWPDFRQIYVAETSNTYFKFETKTRGKLVGEISLSPTDGKPRLNLDASFFAYGGTLSGRTPYDKDVEVVQAKIKERCK